MIEFEDMVHLEPNTDAAAEAAAGCTAEACHNWANSFCPDFDDMQQARTNQNLIGYLNSAVTLPLALTLAAVTLTLALTLT